MIVYVSNYEFWDQRTVTCQSTILRHCLSLAWISSGSSRGFAVSVSTGLITDYKCTWPHASFKKIIALKLISVHVCVQYACVYQRTIFGSHFSHATVWNSRLHDWPWEILALNYLTHHTPSFLICPLEGWSHVLRFVKGRLYQLSCHQLHPVAFEKKFKVGLVVPEGGKLEILTTQTISQKKNLVYIHMTLNEQDFICSQKISMVTCG